MNVIDFFATSKGLIDSKWYPMGSFNAVFISACPSNPIVPRGLMDSNRCSVDSKQSCTKGTNGH